MGCVFPKSGPTPKATTSTPSIRTVLSNKTSPRKVIPEKPTAQKINYPEIHCKTSPAKKPVPKPPSNPFFLRLKDFCIKPSNQHQLRSNFSPTQIKYDAESTRIIVHHRYPALVDAFLTHKREHGSAIEKDLYTEAWTWQQQISRLIAKRPLVFMNATDYTVLRDGSVIKKATEKWDRVGTMRERYNKHSKLSLEDYLSYDEIMLGSLIGGRGYNEGKRGREGTFEERGIIVGLVGARFERADRMDSLLILDEDLDQDGEEGKSVVMNEELVKSLQVFFGRVKRERSEDTVDEDAVDGGDTADGDFKGGWFDKVMYKARMRITVDMLLWEASSRAQKAKTSAYVHVAGFGLGVWAMHHNQMRWFLEVWGVAIGQEDLGPIGTVESAHILRDGEGPGKRTVDQKRIITLRSAKKGVDGIFSGRSPAKKLSGDKRKQLLVVSYAWDGDSFPGNEYWAGKLQASGDPAAACMSTIGELHSPIINPGFLDRIELEEDTNRQDSGGGTGLSQRSRAT
ncbi:hypothetical protein BT63DRAFT_441762 [Microthyrium microscopicum]|uniref:Uncharacterized protein n=1 Tax=Microthyrium microscopicum TaxID=703497 RepID=A0A6A6U5G2_9PEZI|nr:hypothetical protein BT63DRAFT_441762 [Microthyrium microscopicum]